MKNKVLKAAITSALTIAFAVPAFANPFSDVEQGHWAYDAVENLAAAGVIEGYGDNTFKGDKNITRYEMAQMVAKAMGHDLNGEQKATVEKLAVEFSDELKNMGIAIDDVKAEQERVKISGDARLRYATTDANGDDTDYRARIAVDGKINDNLNFNTRVTSGNIGYDGKAEGIKLDTANVGFNALGLENTLGRQDLLIGTGMIMDDTITGLSSEIGGLKVFVGNYNEDDNKERVYGAELKTGIFDGLNLNYMKADDQNGGQDKAFYGVDTKIGISKNVSLVADYAKEDKSGDDAFAYGVNFDKLGLSVMHKDVEAGAHTNYTGVTGLNDVSFLNEGYKGMEYKLTREVADNTVLTVAYQDFKNQAGNKKDDRTSAMLNVNF